MANVVDCSVETVEKEWARIRVEHSVKPPVDYSKQISEGSVDNAVIESSESQEQHLTGAEWAQEKQDVLGRWISKGLQLVFVKTLKLDIDVEAFDEFSLLSAEMLAKYYPNASALEIIAKFERELVWGWSALMLVVAIFKGFRLKAEQNKLDSPKTEKGVIENVE